MTPPSAPRTVEIAFGPAWWSVIGTTRHFVEGVCRTAFGPDTDGMRVALAAHELLENAVKYGPGPDAPVRCALSVEPSEIRLAVSNQARPDQVQRLAAHLEAVMDGDPEAMYMRLMEESLERETSGLGLARIRCEAGAGLELAVDGPELTLTARFFRTPA